MNERVSVTREECIATVKLGHETVRCVANHKIDEPHRNDCYGVWPPCSNCQGLEDHSPKCPTPDRVGSASTWATVEWLSGGKPKVRCGRRARLYT